MWQEVAMDIASYLVLRNLKPAAFASEIGVAPSTVTRWVRGERRPAVDLLAKLQSVTGGAVTVDDFPAKKTVDQVSP